MVIRRLSNVLGLALLLGFGISLSSCSSSDEQSEEQMEITQEEEVNLDDSSMEDSETSMDDGYSDEAEVVSYGEEDGFEEDQEKTLDEVLDETVASDDGMTDYDSDYDSQDSMASMDSTYDEPATTTYPEDDGLGTESWESTEPMAVADNSYQEAPSTPQPTSYNGNTFNYIVQPGDTLGNIATKVFGSPAKWQNLANINGLHNPNIIFPGDEISIPLDESSQRFADAYNNSPAETIIVQEGDTLASIAKDKFGTENGWKVIWKQNMNTISNPNTIYVGQKIAFKNMHNIYSH